MTRITAVWALSLLLLSGVSSADPQPWMVKENPDELGVDIIADCLVRLDAVDPNEIVESVLVHMFCCLVGHSRDEKAIKISESIEIEFDSNPLDLREKQ